MSDVVNVGFRTASIDVSPQFDVYSKVIIHIDNDNAISVGNNTGRVLEIDNPFGTREMAQNILNKLHGFRYQPWQAEDALLDPAAEIGDAVNTASSYGGLYMRSRKFGPLMRADISAPHDEEINHEYKYESSQERKFNRVTGEIKASLIITNNLIQSEVIARQNADNEMYSRITQTASAITAEVGRATEEEGRISSSLSLQASQIAAKVSSSGGGSSFSWILNASSHIWKANSTEVMKISASGLWLKGTIEASKGKIGGFDIGSDSLTYNGLTWGNTSKNKGAYIGQSGIQLGKNFKVDNSGNVTANSMTLAGTLKFLDSQGNIAGTMSAANLQKGAQSAYTNGSYWSGGAGAGYSAYGGLTGAYMDTISLNSGVFKMNGHNVYLGTLYINGSPYNVLRWI